MGRSVDETIQIPLENRPTHQVQNVEYAVQLTIIAIRLESTVKFMCNRKIVMSMCVEYFYTISIESLMYPFVT
jgi:hypothetical protein